MQECHQNIVQQEQRHQVGNERSPHHCGDIEGICLGSSLELANNSECGSQEYNTRRRKEAGLQECGTTWMVKGGVRLIRSWWEKEESDQDLDRRKEAWTGRSMAKSEVVIPLARLFLLWMNEWNLIQGKKEVMVLCCLSPTQYTGTGLSLSRREHCWLEVEKRQS